MRDRPGFGRGDLSGRFPRHAGKPGSRSGSQHHCDLEKVATISQFCRSKCANHQWNQYVCAVFTEIYTPSFCANITQFWPCFWPCWCRMKKLTVQIKRCSRYISGVESPAKLADMNNTGFTCDDLGRDNFVCHAHLVLGGFWQNDQTIKGNIALYVHSRRA